MSGGRAWDAATVVLLIAVLAAALVAACAPRAVFARFPHRVHLAELECGVPGKPACLSCNSCHALERTAAARPSPGALCDSCHHDDQSAVQEVWKREPSRPSGRIAFDHDAHLGLPSIGGQCVHCHAGVVEPGSASMPPMSQCFSCHEHQSEWDQGTCTPCHEGQDLKRLLPRTFLRHDAAFARRHGASAQLEGQLCQACHTQADCTDCHDVTQELGVERRRPERLKEHQVHRADFMTRHAIEARSDPVRCQRCHTPQTCEGCHLERGVSPNRIDARSPHPPGFVGSDPTIRSLHGREARRDILACASCHDQGPATNCIRCHKVGGYGGNPHPGGRFLEGKSTSQGMCRYCHE